MRLVNKIAELLEIAEVIAAAGVIIGTVVTVPIIAAAFTRCEAVVSSCRRDKKQQCRNRSTDNAPNHLSKPRHSETAPLLFGRIASACLIRPRR